MQKVLMIEDEILIVSVLKGVLESGGFEVTIATDPEQGLAAARNDDFQVVVTDLLMPGLNGMEIIKALHETKPHLPVILLTGFDTPGSAIEAMKLGAYDYIAKPPLPQEFLALVR